MGWIQRNQGARDWTIERVHLGATGEKQIEENETVCKVKFRRASRWPEKRAVGKLGAWVVWKLISSKYLFVVGQNCQCLL